MSLSNYNVDLACEKLGFSKEVALLLKTPQRELQVELPVHLHGGKLEVLVGYRVQHSDTRGPCLGGVRYEPSLCLSSIRELASLNTWRAAVSDLAFGGAQGGIALDYHGLNEQEQEEIARLYVSRIDCIIGPHVDVLSTDQNVDSQTISWMLDEYCKKHGFQPACVTGKPLKLFGTQLGQEGSGIAAYYACLRIAQERGLAAERFTLQGYNQDQSVFADLISQKGGKVLAIGFEGQVFFAEFGLNIPEINVYFAKHGSLLGYQSEGVKSLLPEELFGLACDVFVAGDFIGSLGVPQARSLQAKLVFELAPAAITEEADLVLLERDLLVIPDLIGSLGDTVLSYFEWVQNLQHFRWDRGSIVSELERIVAKSCDETLGLAEDLKLSLRQASYVLACERVASAATLRGHR